MYSKILFSGIFALFISVNSFGQQTINATIMHGGLQREYILYVPANYSGSEAVPLLFNFHGYTSNASDQMIYGDFRSIADTAGFIIVHPQGTVDNNGQTHFNVGWLTSTVDDVGFTLAMLDSLSNEYNIDQERIYSTGMSNGGFMSFLLACELSDRIAAIGSVTGSMTLQSPPTCNPLHPVPVIQIHGTADGTVTYTGTQFSEPVQDVIDFWTGFNNCDATATTENVPNTSTTDGSTVEKFTHSNGDNCAEVVHYKVTNGSHTWPGSIIPLGGTNYDIDASLEVWKFVSQFTINGRVDCLSVGIDDEVSKTELVLFPNPTSTSFSIEGLNEQSDFELISILGERVLTGTIDAEEEVSVSNLTRGIYLLKIDGSVFELTVE